MAEISYPSNLSGVLVNSNSFQVQTLTRRNDLQSGAPVFRLESDNGWVGFNVAWSYDAAEMQLFENWFRWTIASGSKLFNIELWIDGFSEGKNTKTHECYFESAYKANQVGDRWQVTARLIALELKTFEEADGLSLVNVWEGFENPPAAILSLNDIIELMENTWQP